MTILIINTYRGDVLHAWGGRRSGANQLPNTACGLEMVHPRQCVRLKEPAAVAWAQAKADHRDRGPICLRCDRIVATQR